MMSYWRSYEGSAVKFWLGLGMGIDFRRNRYGRMEVYLVLPLVRIRLNHPNPYYHY